MRIGSSVGTMKIGSTAVAAIKRGTDRVYDADVAAFQKASAAADVSGIMDLVDYLKAESLWDYARFYPMKSSQNAGTGSTVYGLGGLTSNNMTLVNSPTWGSDGVTFASASSQYGTIADFIGDGNLHVFFRVNVTNNAPYFFSQFNGSGDNRSWLMYEHTDGKMRLERSSDGTALNRDSYTTGDVIPIGEHTLSAYWYGASVGTAFDSDSQETTLYGGSVQSARFDGTANIGVMMYYDASGTPSTRGDGTVCASAVIETALTTTQRETITDLINAL